MLAWDFPRSPVVEEERTPSQRRRVAFTVVPSPSACRPDPSRASTSARWIGRGGESAFGDSLLVVPPMAAEQEDAILAVHPPAHLEFLRRAASRLRRSSTSPRPTSRPDSLHLRAGGRRRDAGASGGRSWTAERRRGFAAIRPPGHHATPGRAMGFCLLNNVAIAARAAQRAGLRESDDRRLRRSSRERDPGDLRGRPRRCCISRHTKRASTRNRTARRARPGPTRRASTSTCRCRLFAGDEAFAQIAAEFLFPLARRFSPASDAGLGRL